MILRDGLYWPDHDKDCHPVITKQSKDIENVLKYVDKFDVCVQAGGNVGVWAKILSKHFKTVYTFEPDPENFNCLCANVQEHNVVKLNAAVGDKHKLIDVGSPDNAHDNNCGAYQILGDGKIPTLRIDDLALVECDLIYLDIEGYETFAIDGAISTISFFKPIISLEQKNLPLMYGLDKDFATRYLVEKFGYEVVERVHRDVILAPCS